MQLVRVAQSPSIRSPRARQVLATVTERPRRVLGTVTAPSLGAALTPRLAAPASLVRLVRALGGRVVVTNPVAVARLPHAVASLVHAAVARALGARATDLSLSSQLESRSPTSVSGPALPGAESFARRGLVTRGDERRLARLVAELPADATDALAPGAAWAAVALYEPDMLDVQLPQDTSTRMAPDPPPLVALSRHRLVIVTGRDATPPSWDAIDAWVPHAPSVAWPPANPMQPWFVVRLLVSDAHVAARMDAATLARWATMTGRAGQGSRDRYWHADSWERFREPGSHVGHVTPQVVGQSRRSRTSGEIAQYGALALTPDVERGVGVPPGYCLVDCAGLLDVAIVAA